MTGSDVDEIECTDRLALLDTPSGFALFLIQEDVFIQRDAIWAWLTDAKKARHLARVLEYIKVKDKSVTTREDGPGEELSKLIDKFWTGTEKELYVKDEKLRHVIYSNLGIKCSDDNYVVNEVMWGLNNVMCDLVFEERDHIEPGFQKTEPCAGLQKCIKEFKLFGIPIDQEFILHAAGLYRCHTMLRTTMKDLRKACDRHVPRIRDLVKNDKDYADVMAKILTPGLEPDWDFTERFEGSVAQQLKDLDAAAEVARKKVGYQMYHFMSATFMNLRGLPEIIKKAEEFFDSLPRSSVDQRPRMEKRNMSDIAKSSWEVEGSQDTYGSNEATSKKCRICESSTDMIYC